MSATLRTAGLRAFAAALTTTVAAAAFINSLAVAQDQIAPPRRAPAQGNVAAGNGAANGIGIGNQGLGPQGAPGGAAAADFDSLIDLITSTVDAESWEENGTGSGQIQEFAINGVYVDAQGALRMRPGAGASLTSIRARGQQSTAAKATKASLSATAASKGAAPRAEQRGVRVASELRFVSLPRLEAAIADHQRRHVALDSAMLTLAGLQRVSYVLVYPETGDLVLAGPAGDWQSARGGGLISAETGRPLVRLDDLLVLWRRQRAEPSTAFGCSIVPRTEALARTQEYVAASAATPIEPSGRRQWLNGLRDTLGVQDVEYYHIDPDTRIAGLLLAADYHMKLVGMGLAPGVPGVRSYLSTVRLGADRQAPPMAVLRWWFSMPRADVEADAEHNAFAMPSRCVQVMSENEFLAARGERVHTGASEDLNRQFAESFTKEFAALAAKYPVYAELERVFELALALELIQREGLAEKAGWTPSLLLDNGRLRLPKRPAPKAVETVINHRVIAGKHIIAGISGGVLLDGGKSLAVSAAKADSAATLAKVKAAPRQAAGQAPWWWD